MFVAGCSASNPPNTNNSDASLDSSSDSSDKPGRCVFNTHVENCTPPVGFVWFDPTGLATDCNTKKCPAGSPCSSFVGSTENGFCE